MDKSLDIQLLGIEGLETSRRIRKMENMVDVPIKVVSSYAWQMIYS
jgi:CheY-like chemotaxis protein